MSFPYSAPKCSEAESGCTGFPLGEGGFCFTALLHNYTGHKKTLRFVTCFFEIYCSVHGVYHWTIWTGEFPNSERALRISGTETADNRLTGRREFRKGKIGSCGRVLIFLFINNRIRERNRHLPLKREMLR